MFAVKEFTEKLTNVLAVKSQRWLCLSVSHGYHKQLWNQLDDEIIARNQKLEINKFDHLRSKDIKHISTIITLHQLPLSHQRKFMGD